MTRFLITTADERMWGFDRPVLFLGEWCRRYDRRQVWSAMDAQVAAPYGVTTAEKRRDLATTRRIVYELLDELTAALNAFHGSTLSRRSWQIVLGHWLRRYVDTMFNRFATVEQTVGAHQISEARFICDRGEAPLAAPDSKQFILATNDDRWNSLVYARALEMFGITVTAIQPADAGETTAAPVAASSPRASIGDTAAAVLRRFRRDSDAVIVHSYLPRPTEMALSLSLGQVPQVWRTPPAPATAPSRAARQRLTIETTGRDGFDRFVRLMLPEVVPVCFLEGHAAVARTASAWPARPRFIFTSNSFDTDESFKVWCAQQTEAGRPYFAGQHGNNYGTHFYASNADWPERAASDAFFTWGWTDGRPSTVPAFNFKSLRPAPAFNAAGGLLLVEECVNHRVTAWDGYYEFGVYQEEQFRFVAALPAAVRAAVTVRLHREQAIHTWFEADRWRDRMPDIVLERGLQPMDALIAANRLVVYAYESTGVLENFSRDIPTLCFWSAGLDHILPEARPYYDRLVDAGVIATSAERAAALVAEYWDDVGGWWRSAAVRGAVREYCDRFARREPHPVRTMRRLLLQQVQRLEAIA